jgi:hypothetical protein
MAQPINAPLECSVILVAWLLLLALTVAELDRYVEQPSV